MADLRTPIASVAEIVPEPSLSQTPVSLPPEDGACKARSSHGVFLPDPACTPGAYNPSLTLTVLKRSGFRTGCGRNMATSASAKNKTYQWYGVTKPKNNSGTHMVCELDHLVSLEIGGADTLDNIWPHCGPSRAALNNRYFKKKDLVENYLAAEIRAGNRDLREVQKGIAEDWTQYLDAATTFYNHHKKRNDGG